MHLGLVNSATAKISEATARQLYELKHCYTITLWGHHYAHEEQAHSVSFRFRMLSHDLESRASNGIELVFGCQPKHLRAPLPASPNSLNARRPQTENPKAINVTPHMLARQFKPRLVLKGASRSCPVASTAILSLCTGAANKGYL